MKLEHSLILYIISLLDFFQYLPTWLPDHRTYPPLHSKHIRQDLSKIHILFPLWICLTVLCHKGFCNQVLVDFSIFTFSHFQLTTYLKQYINLFAVFKISNSFLVSVRARLLFPLSGTPSSSWKAWIIHTLHSTLSIMSFVKVSHLLC